MPGMVTANGQPRYADYANYITNHQRKPGIGPLAGWRTGGDGRGDPNPNQLNRLIRELLAARGDGLRWSNSDPVTGQAAWFDLRIKIEKPPPGRSAARLYCDHLTGGLWP